MGKTRIYYSLLLSYGKDWDKGDSEEVVVPILLTEDIALAVATAKSALETVTAPGTEVSAYRQTPNMPAALTRESTSEYLQIWPVFRYRCYEMQNGRAVNPQIEWLDKKAKALADKKT